MTRCASAQSRPRTSAGKLSRLTANKELKVLSYVPENREMIFLDGGWEVEWRPFTFSFITSPGGAPVHLRGMVLGVHKKLPDGSWKAFRGAGITV